MSYERNVSNVRYLLLNIPPSTWSNNKTQNVVEGKRRLRLLKPKKLFPLILATTFLLSLNIVPSNAVAETVNCGRTGTFTIELNVVTGNTFCNGSVNIPNGVTRIGPNAFKDNFDISSVVIPDTVLVIDAGAFWGADEITILTIGNGVTTIGEDAFNGASRITSLNIPNSVTTIGSNAFQGLSRLTSLTLGNRLTTIGPGAFGFTGLSSVTIPNTVTEIGDGAFESTGLDSVIIPDSVTTLGGFMNSTLTSVTIGNRVTSIVDDAFNGTRLTSVTIPNSVTTIGNRAFKDVLTVTSVTIGNGVTSIGATAFQGNTSLTSVTFLGNAPATFADAFSGVPTGTKANVAYNATGFPANGSTWNGLIVSYGSAPAENSRSTTASVTTPKIIKSADVVFNLKNKKYLSKNTMKIKIRKNKSFKRNPEDLYRYSIFKASKKTCSIQGNYVTSLKKTGTCDLYATRTTTKGVKYKYWVRINYTK